MYTYKICARHSHCIPPYIILEEGATAQLLNNDFKNFLESINSTTIIIKGHGLDIDKKELMQSFPFLADMDEIQYMQVGLPPWSERKDGDYHHATHYMKQFSRILPCTKDNHSMNFIYSDFDGYKQSHTKMAKQFYGFHCALFDSIELAFYEKTLQLYCCDKHFKNAFSTNYLIFENV